MGLRFDAMEAAQRDDELAAIYRRWAEHTRWPWMRWYYNRRANKAEESADIWRGLEWRKQRAIEHQMWLVEHEKVCPGRTQDE